MDGYSKEKRAEYNKQYRSINKQKINITKKTWSDENRHSTIRSDFKWKYKTTDEVYDKYIATTHCECCGDAFTPKANHTTKCQDHNHDTKEIRGVLCNACNSAEGFLKTPERAYQVACYMASHTPLNELIKGLL